METEFTRQNPVNDLLQQPEQQEALAQLLRDLPVLVARLEQLEKSVSFAEHVLQDKESVLPLVKEVERRVEQTGLTKAHLDSMIELSRLLPEVTPLLKQGVTSLLFVKSVVEDEQSMKDLLASPPRLPMLEETKRRYTHKQLEKKRISPLRILRLVRHPMWKQGFLYVESLLETFEMKKKKRG